MRQKPLSMAGPRHGIPLRALPLHLAGMRTEIMRRRVRTLSQQLARQDGGS
jgi:hypothetical protein